MIEPTSNLGMDDAHDDESWRDQVASRLDTYRSRSKRKLSGNFSMRFNFDGELAPPRQQICVPASALTEDLVENELVVEEPVEVAEELPRPEPPQTVEVVQPEPPPPPPPLRPSVPFKRKIVMEPNVIEFPRLFPPEPPPSGSLAEPLLPSLPRILDAPEIAEPLLETPMLDGMRLDNLEPETIPELEVPLQVAPIGQRVTAALYDGIVVLLASGIFGAIVFKLLDGIEWSKPLLLASAVIPIAFWMAYQYLFVVYGGRTPGMAMVHLAFSTLAGEVPTRRQRRTRILATVLSCSSMMLGFLWSVFDEDTLCWHDRISRTYATQQKL